MASAAAGAGNIGGEGSRPDPAGAGATAAAPNRVGIRVDSVGHEYDGVRVLSGVSLSLTERRIGIIGANGSGKSTLARTFNGLLTPDSGSVWVGAEQIAGPGLARKAAKSARAAVRSRVGFMFADASAQIIMPTAREDIALSLRGVPVADRPARVDALAERFGLTELLDRPAQLLSSGQQQLLAFATVLATEPEILVCDEPTTLLDLRNVLLFERTIAGLDQQVILLTHHLELLATFDRVIVMEAGRVVHDGAPAAALAAYRSMMAEAAP